MEFYVWYKSLHKNSVTTAAHLFSFSLDRDLAPSLFQTVSFLARCRVPSTVSQTSVATMAYFTRRAVKPKGYYAALNASSSADLFDSDDGD